MGEDRELIEMFIEETRERLEAIEPALVELERAESAAEKERLLNDVFRHLHSTKGSAGYLNLTDLVALVHAAEQLADVLRKGAPVRPEHVDLLLQTVSQVRAYLAFLAGQGDVPEGLAVLTQRLQEAAAAASQRSVSTAEAPAVPPSEAPSESEARSEELKASETELTSSTVRVPVHVLDRLGRLAEEMLVTRNRITALAANLQDGELVGASKKLSVMVSELQDIAALTRLQPISSLFSQMPRVVRDAARATGKEVDLVIDGGRLEVDRRILQELRDPLVHLLRNAVDHGIESPERRIAYGKPSRGRITLRAMREGSNLVIEVSDDGKGIDYEAVRQKAVERGFVSAREAATLTEAELNALLLRPGFSTRDQATELSGRGVGLDVVAVRMQELGGNLTISSVLGQGTTIRLVVPTSVSVMNTLVFTARGYLLGIPYNVVQEIVLITDRDIEHYGEQDVFRLRDQLVPLFTLASWPERGEGTERQTGKHYVLVLRGEGTLAGLLCDGIARFEELIVKPVGNLLRGVESVSGLATLGTGEIVLILEPEKILAEAGLAMAKIQTEQVQLGLVHEHHTAEDDLAERLVLLKGYGEHRYALPVRLVSRIVRFTPEVLAVFGERVYYRTEEALIPLVDLDRALRLGSGGVESGGIAVLLRADNLECGFVAAQVVRIGRVGVEPEASDRHGVAGLLNLPDGVYLMVDVPTVVHHELRRLYESRQESRSVRGKKALIVEDSVFYRDALEAVLKRAGYAVSAVGSVEEALVFLARVPDVALVITDYMLPGKSGLDLIQAVRNGETAVRTDVPIVVLSQYLSDSQAGPEVAQRLRAAGANAVYAKFDELEQSELLEQFRHLVVHDTAEDERTEQQHAAEDETVHVLAVNLGPEVYGVPIDRVREITTLDGVTPTPLDDAGFLGLANIRGEIVPVFDLGGVLRRPIQTNGEAVDVVTLTSLGPMVLRGESIRGTIRVPVKELREPTGNLGPLAELVPSVATLPDCLLQVVELEKLASVCLGRRS
ncbi:chemotaxis protein CheW [Thermomicrobium sp. 4228-Ro]|uniref:chemotaxis protein CheW n=1 Tax=Thermomicrobium sp. 4228-Ro TaxID=2993937 RepID=UPI002248ECFB|nr:chemotaxis protein CheW [Thermomicrobium sp. 4228-Ro]MCX2728216.1 chemotaxis protein CheW [Thermomicrobium sp. 4228-Ro]